MHILTSFYVLRMKVQLHAKNIRHLSNILRDHVKIFFTCPILFMSLKLMILLNWISCHECANANDNSCESVTYHSWHRNNSFQFQLSLLWCILCLVQILKSKKTKLFLLIVFFFLTRFFSNFEEWVMVWQIKTYKRLGDMLVIALCLRGLFE